MIRLLYCFLLVLQPNFDFANEISSITLLPQYYFILALQTAKILSAFVPVLG